MKYIQKYEAITKIITLKEYCEKKIKEYQPYAERGCTMHESKFKFIVGNFYSVEFGGGVVKTAFLKDENGSNVSSRFIDFDCGDTNIYIIDPLHNKKFDGDIHIIYDDPMHNKKFEAVLTKDASIEDYKKRMATQRFDL